jgi:Tfp pilus assembly protein PilF
MVDQHVEKGVLRTEVVVALLLILVTVLTFSEVRKHGFVDYDDGLYVYENRLVQQGLTWNGVEEVFNRLHLGFWFPLTWLSFMVNYEIHGLNPGGYHVTNLLLHVSNTLLLFLILRRMTGTIWQSAFVAALFAIHPLRVESVAWVTERKDMLSTFFWLLTLGGYFHYVKDPKTLRYVLVMLCFACALMAKPMVVTLPFVLLLLDYWPLKRFSFSGDRRAEIEEVEPCGLQRSALPRLILEKVPLILLAIGISIVTLLGQSRDGSLVSLESFPLDIRLGNALISYVSYIWKMIWPHGLAVYYPHPGHSIAILEVVGAAFLLGGISVFVARVAPRHPYLVVGWLWYLGTLVPAIGLAQSGYQAMADRFTYIPLVGLFIAVAWGANALVAKWNLHRAVPIASAGVLIPALMVCTFLQVRHWKNSATLFQHTLDVTSDNYYIHRNMGVVLTHQGRLEEAMRHFREAVRIKPDFAEVRNNIGVVLVRQGRVGEAIPHYRRALESKPDFVEVEYNLGTSLVRQGKLEEAAAHFLSALQTKSDFAEAHYCLGLVLARQGKTKQAMAHYSSALEIKPDFEQARHELNRISERIPRSLLGD